MKTTRGRQHVGALAVLVCTLSGPARAHWCHDLWASAYNIVVKPAQDSVTVPASGRATLDVYVQNNMGYPLQDFKLVATAPGFNITVSTAVPKKARFLLPGESLRHTLSIAQSGGGADFDVKDLSFDVSFGSGGQASLYGPDGRAKAVERTKAGELVPGKPMSFLPHASQNDQSYHLWSSAKADYQDAAAGVSELMAEFCVGRSSYSSGSGASIADRCSSPTCDPASITVVTRGETKYDYQHLWSAGELAARKGAPGFPADTLRSRLTCAMRDASPAFQYFPYLVLGYLGESASARTFLTGKISSGTNDEKAAAKAALLLFGAEADRTAYLSDVTAAMSSTSLSIYVRLVAAAALAIGEHDDTAAQRLIDNVAWKEPLANRSSLNGGDDVGLFAGHLLNIVAWERRGWVTDAADQGGVSFYGASVAPAAAAPRAPTGVACAPLSSGAIRVSWSPVTQTLDGGVASVQGYVTYRGTASRGAATTPPAGYTNREPTSGVTASSPATITGLSGTQPSYFSVVAVDNSNPSKTSSYSTEVSCTPTYPPSASMSCTGATGAAPLSVSCRDTSTDENGATDITSRSWTLDGVAQDAGTTYSARFDTQGGRTLRLTIVDRAGMRSTATQAISASAGGGNQLPTARASATPSSGPSPLRVTFSSTGSSDPEDGTNVTYRWDFGDGTPPSTEASPTHTYTDSTERTYEVVLRVTDTAGNSSSASLIVSVTTNHPPDVAEATASRVSGYTPLVVAFSAQRVTDPESNTMTFRWSFGDQSAEATGVTTEHTYAQAGTYTAELTATDSAGASSTKEFVITVHAQGAANRPPDCSAAFVTPDAGTLPLTVTMDATGCVDPDGDALTVTWLVSRSSTFTTDTFTESRSLAVLRDLGPNEITLNVVDSAPEPAQINRTFIVTVASAGAVQGGFGCSAGWGAASAPGAGSSGALLLGAGLGLAMLRRRRRR